MTPDKVAEGDVGDSFNRVGLVPALTWHERTAGAGHIAVGPDPTVGFTQQNGRSMTCDGHS